MMYWRPMLSVMNRALNWHHSTFPVVDGKNIEMKHPFVCDDCPNETACYGTGGALRCTFCHQANYLKLIGAEVLA